MKIARQNNVQEVLTVVVLQSGRSAVKCHGVQPGLGTGAAKPGGRPGKKPLQLLRGEAGPKEVRDAYPKHRSPDLPSRFSSHQQ